MKNTLIYLGVLVLVGLGIWWFMMREPEEVPTPSPMTPEVQGESTENLGDPDFDLENLEK